MLFADHLGKEIGRIVSGGGKGAGVSGITCAIVIGVLLANAMQVRAALRPGLEFAVRKLLRLGIILVGIKLSLLDLVHMGFWGIPVVLTVILCALLLTSWFGRRLQLTPTLAMLTAASTAICGVTAALAVAPTIDADDKEVAYTVANVTLFGMMAMFAYPYLAHFLFAHQPAAAGLFLGTAIHDTSQVMGAALSYNQLFGDETAMKVATMTKLTRNVFLVAVVPWLAFVAARSQGQQRRRVDLGKLFPLFVLGFATMAVVRSLGDATMAAAGQRALGIWRPETWRGITKFLTDGVAYHCLGCAMAAVGLTTDLKTFRGLGLKPLYVGAASAVIVGGVGLALASVVGPRIDARLPGHAPGHAPVPARSERAPSPPPPPPSSSPAGPPPVAAAAPTNPPPEAAPAAAEAPAAPPAVAPPAAPASPVVEAPAVHRPTRHKHHRLGAHRSKHHRGTAPVNPVTSSGHQHASS